MYQLSDKKPHPPDLPGGPTLKYTIDLVVHDWINYDCPIAGKTQIHQALIDLLVERLYSLFPESAVGQYPKQPPTGSQLPDHVPDKPPELPPLPGQPDMKPPALPDNKPPDRPSKPERPDLIPNPKPPDLPIAKPTPKRGMESKTNHAIKRSKPKAKAAKPTHKKPSKHK